MDDKIRIQLEALKVFNESLKRFFVLTDKRMKRILKSIEKEKEENNG